MRDLNPFHGMVKQYAPPGYIDWSSKLLWNTGTLQPHTTFLLPQSYIIKGLLLLQKVDDKPSLKIRQQQ